MRFATKSNPLIKMCTFHHDLIAAKGKETRHADNTFTTDIIELELSEIPVILSQNY